MNINRPISPYITIYNVDLVTVFSIMHRITGIVLTLALVLFVLFLKLFSFSASCYVIYWCAYTLNAFSGIFLSLIAILLIFTTMYHLLTGIRHMIWDTGSFLEIENMFMSVYIVGGLSICLTLSIWFLL